MKIRFIADAYYNKALVHEKGSVKDICNKLGEAQRWLSRGIAVEHSEEKVEEIAEVLEEIAEVIKEEPKKVAKKKVAKKASKKVVKKVAPKKLDKEEVLQETKSTIE